ncbi:MAG: hypothetical protein RLZZ561_1558 [Pseudomonadota bacterium]|jgi:UDP-glucose 4-epimerase
MPILLTGGAGYIGSHTAVALASAGFAIICFDNLSNSSAETVKRVEAITGKNIPLIVGDVRDQKLLEAVIRDNEVDAVIHFAGLKAVGEATANPLIYYDNNVKGTLSLIEAMTNCGLKTLVFSSSATVYGEPQYLPLDETHPLSVTNPYGRTKLMAEEILGDIAVSDPSWRIAILRYFNPVGAHSSGLIGEDPSGIPSNLMPFISRVAAGRLKELSVFGDDYDTSDGTCVRDFIHIEDLAQGHIAALKAIGKSFNAISTWNFGTGRGYSVVEMIRAFERVNGVSVPFRIAERREGDVAACYASPDKAMKELDWQAKLGLEEMCHSAWQFEQMRNLSP